MPAGAKPLPEELRPKLCITKLAAGESLLHEEPGSPPLPCCPLLLSLLVLLLLSLLLLPGRPEPLTRPGAGRTPTRSTRRSARCSSVGRARSSRTPQSTSSARSWCAPPLPPARLGAPQTLQTLRPSQGARRCGAVGRDAGLGG